MGLRKSSGSADGSDARGFGRPAQPLHFASSNAVLSPGTYRQRPDTAVLKRAVACAFLILGCAAISAMNEVRGAEPLVSEGVFSVSYTLATPSPAPALDVGEGRDLATNRYLITTYNDAGGGFLHMTAGECINIRFSAREKRTLDTHAYCHFKDRDGDDLFTEYTTGTPKPAQAISTSWTFVSGTGKYEGITGSAEATNSSNIDDQGGYQAAGRMAGSYKINRPSAGGKPDTHD